ncbi:MAG: hypothetical protein NTX05_07150 [Fusobacteria bacterium]|nr:hypothetical protein [Fusobacteriota bacterium]
MITLYHGTECRLFDFEKRIKEEKGNFLRVEVYDFTQNSDFQAFFESLMTSSLFEKSKLVIGKRVNKIKKIGEFISQVERIAHTSNLVLLEGEGELLTAKQKEKLSKNVTIYENKDKNLSTEFTKILCESLECERVDAQQLVNALPENFYTYCREIEKLTLFFHGRKFKLEEALKFVTYKEQEIFYYIERYFQNKELKTLYEFVERERQYMLLLALLTDDILVYKILKEYEREKNLLLSAQNYTQFSKIHAPTLTKLYYKHPYAYFKKLEMIDKISFEFIDFALDAIIECEVGIKSGRKSDSIAIFQLLKQLQQKF